MNSRERVQRAINFQGPDRAPISHAILPSTQIKYGQALQEILDSVHEDFGWEFLPDLKREDYPPLYKAGRNYDDFGTLWDVEIEGMCGIPIEWPLEDWDNYKNFTWPDFSAGPPKSRLYSGHLAGKDERYYARGAWITFFEVMQQLRGMENLLMDLAFLPNEIYQLRDDLLAFNLTWIDKWLEHDYDGLHFADDWGSQSSLLISPARWREFYRPVYQAMFEKVTNAGLDVHFHSDGYIIDIIPDLIDMGAKVLNCQASVIGYDVLQKNFAGTLCFRTDLDRQKIVPFGTPEQVQAHILDVFAHLGTPRGGIIACGEIGPDTPLENIRAMYDTFMNYRY
ncbi:MAG: uroporphyrinogen decarboxylase family protein [Armatimonadota bacterium]